MKIEDSVHGVISIPEGLLFELVVSPEIQRLKGISQPGYIEPYFPGTDHSRFSHSVGVCHLLRAAGAPLAEQAAGLLHDVSHTAFSHCVDYALAEGSEEHHDYQDNAMRRYLERSSIPAILRRWGIELEYLLEKTHFRLLETDLPDLCADRIDYVLRTGIHAGEITAREAQHFLEALEVVDRRWVFRHPEPAQRFADYFLRINLKYYCGVESAMMFRTVGDTLKYCLKKRLIGEEDLFTTDAAVLAKIREHLEGDETLRHLWERMNRGSARAASSVTTVKVKSRCIDPLLRAEEGRILPLSEYIPGWADTVREQSVPKVYCLNT